MSSNLNSTAILIINGIDYCCIISRITKNEAINLLRNAYLSEKKWLIIKQKSFYIIYKMNKKNYNVC